MELESAILNFKRHAQTSPDQGTRQATEIFLEAWRGEALVPVLLKSFKVHAWRVFHNRLRQVTSGPSRQLTALSEFGHHLRKFLVI